MWVERRKHVFLFPPLFFPLYLPLLSVVCARPELDRRQRQKKFFIKIFFCGRFWVRPWRNWSFQLFFIFVHRIQVPWSNFIKNPFYYFGIFSLISKSPIGPIICKSAKKCLPNNLFLCDLFKKVLDFLYTFFSTWLQGGSICLRLPLQEATPDAPSQHIRHV